MTYYCQIKNGVVANRAVFADAIPADWPRRDSWVQTGTAQIGWSYASGVFSPPPASPPLPVTAVDVKAEAYRRIVAIMPEHKQRNTMALGLEAIQKYGTDPTAWPADLQAINADAMAKWNQIKAIRTKSDEIEAVSPIPQDFRNDSYWQ